MKIKRILTAAIIVAISICIISCTKKQDEVKNIAADTVKLQSRLESAIELGDMFFEGKITSVKTVDALIPKYNVDITKYTLYTVEVTDSLDGIMPKGQVDVYCLGTTEHFPSRKTLERGNTYILNAQPWVYGEKVVYLLSIYQASYPRIDTAGFVSMWTKEGTESYGSKSDYISLYTAAREGFEKTAPDYFLPKTVLGRIKALFDNVNKVNSENWKKEGIEFSFMPDDEFITKTRNRTKTVCDSLGKLDPDTVTFANITEILK